VLQKEEREEKYKEKTNFEGVYLRNSWGFSSNFELEVLTPREFMHRKFCVVLFGECKLATYV